MKAFIKTKCDKFESIETDNIFYCEASKDYVILKTIDKIIAIHSTFEHVVEKLPSNFHQVHRSFCVNINHIREINERTIYFNIEYQLGVINISESYYKQFKNSLTIIGK